VGRRGTLRKKEGNAYLSERSGTGWTLKFLGENKGLGGGLNDSAGLNDYRARGAKALTS